MKIIVHHLKLTTSTNYGKNCDKYCDIRRNVVSLVFLFFGTFHGKQENELNAPKIRINIR